MDFGRHFLDGSECFCVDRKFKRRGEGNRSEHAKLILVQSQARGTNGANDAPLEIILAADEVNHLTSDGIEEDAVDREIAALGVLLGGGEGDAVRVTAVAVGGICP